MMTKTSIRFYNNTPARVRWEYVTPTVFYRVDFIEEYIVPLLLNGEK